MNNKYTLKSLCEQYDKIEIPIIQRDYAQGRENETKVRSKFVEFITNSFSTHKAEELDFVYGNVREENNKSTHTFIPVDGQQRLTTLWLLHWFLAVREGRLKEISGWMQRFTYETRPSSHSFCSRMLNESFPSECLEKVDEFIINEKWFDTEWKNDGTVNGMLRMLHDFAQQDVLLCGEATLDELVGGLFSFYLVPLELFGLSDELYIRMNARGKVLTDFENFKSEFYKILKDYPRLDEVKDKMEMQWVENLWPYKKKNTYVIDQCFMNLLKFITRCLYFRQAKPRANKYEEDFLDMKILNIVYSQEENTDFLLFALDIIPIIANYNNENLLWFKDKPSTLSDILATSIQGGKMEIDMMVILYASLRYLSNHGNRAEIKGFIRVVRNLICNTNDKSERDQPRILGSIDKLSTNIDVYEVVAVDGFNLEGLRDSQCHEEHFKAKIRHEYNKVEELLEKIEDNPWFKGNISNLIAGTYVSKAKDIKDFDWAEEKIKTFDTQRLECLYNHYDEMSQDDFSSVWGDLLDSMLYTHHKSSARLMYDDEALYSKNPAIISLAVSYMDSKENDLEAFLIKNEKRKIRKLAQSYQDFGEIRNVKKQLFLYYVITRRLMGLNVADFFSNGWRIGWLAKEKGFSSLFNLGIDGDPWFSEPGHNPIFQTYGSQFRYSGGLNAEHALPPEIVGNGSPRNTFEKLLDWANT